ncbi:hypothetical protein LTR37_018170 [Vermiconidia calcicola]|uniref:Uncharacterized protein n=1 Tax=Vermiconidia calcicola TaxID=1690605 RepID=A0ACC3MJI9_9PEZI|nr:hypothetical protein LTR37_018170 [Vermiconidia calcicola]
MEQPTPSILVRFPVELQIGIAETLRDRDTIMLSQVNRHFQQLMRPRVTAIKKKETALVRQAQFFKQNSKYSSFFAGGYDVLVTENVLYACFTCFRVRPIDAFSARQIIHCNKIGQNNKAMKNNLRCCTDCSITRKSFRHGMEIRILRKISMLVDKGDRYQKTQVVNVRVRNSELTKYCDKCETLHTVEGWEACGPLEGQPSKRAIKRAQEQQGRRFYQLRFWSPKKKTDTTYRVKAKGRICSNCNADDSEMPLGDFYCPECLTWICWSCCRGRGGELQGHCGTKDQPHSLEKGSDRRETHEKLMRAHWQRTGRTDDIREDYMLADFGLFREAEY